MFDHEKTMFEIYREGGYGRTYRVVYYTELNEHNKESEINRALQGETFYYGFIRDYGKDEAKAVIERFVERLNEGQPLSPDDVDVALAAHAPAAQASSPA